VDIATSPEFAGAMTCFVSHTTIDCHNAYRLSEWWKGVLGYTDIEGDPNEPGHEECMIIDPESGHRLLFIEVPDAELPAKRIHLDLRPRTRDQNDEVARLLGHGATMIDDQRGKYGSGTGWVVLADPEGNQFCILRSPRQLAAAGQ
jgi:catechol 2,3-dioxygenase-like lactoylglutathione lyase family enzyme